MPKDVPQSLSVEIQSRGYEDRFELPLVVDEDLPLFVAPEMVHRHKTDVRLLVPNGKSLALQKNRVLLLAIDASGTPIQGALSVRVTHGDVVGVDGC